MSGAWSRSPTTRLSLIMADALREDPFAEWREMNARHEAICRAGGCDCCAGIVGREPGRRRYWWTGPNGNVTGLCESCCAIWRLNARDDPSLMPISIISCP